MAPSSASQRPRRSGAENRRGRPHKPLTPTNLSGEVIGSLSRYYKVAVPDLLVVCDDVNLPLGRLAQGGRFGRRSQRPEIDRPASGDDRLRAASLGVGRGDVRRDLADHVLARFEPDERSGVDDAIARAADAVELWISDGLAKVMNTFNRVEDNT
jgi:PTH1 family peptidyl-tRNA hydrolase